MSHAPAAARTRSTTKYSSLVSADIYLTLPQAAITGICSRLGAIEANIQQLRQMDRGPPVSVLPTNSLPLALERMSDFDIFDENILTDDYRQEMMAFLQTVGGNTVREFVKRQLRSLFANSLLPGSDLNGRYSKRNFRQTNTLKMP
ncbi:hypothetical protein AAHC03_026480 [Spirometra sp. Aus1]